MTAAPNYMFLDGQKIVAVDQGDGTKALVISSGAGFGPAGVPAYAPVNLANNTRSASFSPLAGRDFYCKISGAGSAPVRLEYSLDGGTTWAPMVTGVDGGAPIVLDSLAYAGSPVMLSGQVSKTGMLVSVMPGTVSGTVTVEFGQ